MSLAKMDKEKEHHTALTVNSCGFGNPHTRCILHDFSYKGTTREMSSFLLGNCDHLSPVLHTA